MSDRVVENSSAEDVKVERVLVTGASGYIACHVVKQLLESGSFIVRGTVRNLNNEKKVKPLKNLCPGSKYPLELAEAELLDEHCWERAMVDCKYVIHMASPFPASNPRDESELIEPAVEGTINVLQACSKANIKRVVLTSSIVAITSGNLDSKRELTEEDWSVENQCGPYEKSKLMAEKAAWDFVKNLPADKKFELVVINPGLVYGPVLHGSNCTSMEIPTRLLERQIPMLPRLHFGVVDVRDLAKAHITALTSVKGPGNRYIAVNKGIWLKDTAKILNDEFRPQGYRVPTAVCPSFGMYVYSLFDSGIRMILPALGKEMSLSNKKIKEDLGFDPIDVEKTLIDMAYSMIEQGFVKKTPKYLGPPENRSTSTDTQPSQ
ncbi:tetraketide alpha-pyrone reductase 1-like [Actinia tenebrosa]|uniref:Tetraketide alpha-pyrone reductase 1-like n=1 Tax=Actinia tenebrosa TaxID=6105 RepID=A0A6P8H9M2_ACTTE|nr:tetraketide alpha-pyrone reductase 1-like [Actinia tenebrosa]